MGLLVLIPALLAIYVLKLYIDHRRVAAKFSHIPGINQFIRPYFPLPQFLRGPLGVRFDRFNPKQPMYQQVNALHREYGPVFKVVSCTWPMVFVADPELVKEIFLGKTKVYAKGLKGYRPLDIFGPSILTTEHDEWHRHRRAAQAAFNDRNIQSVTDATLRIADALFAHWGRGPQAAAAAAAQGPFEVSPGEDMTKLATAVITDAGFGHDLRIFDAEAQKPPKGHSLTMSDMLKGAFRAIVAQFLSPMVFWRVTIPLTLRFPTIRRALDEFTSYLDDLMRENEQTGGKGGDLLSLLVQARHAESEGSRLTDREIHSNSLIFFFAGQETTATALGWALYLLATNPAKQEAFRQAARRMLQEKPAGMDENDFFREKQEGDVLPYADWVARETLRLFPPVAQLGKMASQDDQLGATTQTTQTQAATATTTTTNGAAAAATTTATGGYHIPKGTTVLGSFYTMQRTLVPNGESFEPERWADVKVTGPASLSAAMVWTPFSLGPRNCIGYRFALTEMQVFLTKFILRYSVELVTEPTPKVTITLYPKGLRLRLTPLVL